MSHRSVFQLITAPLLLLSLLFFSTSCDFSGNTTGEKTSSPLASSTYEVFTGTHAHYYYPPSTDFKLVEAFANQNEDALEKSAAALSLEETSPLEYRLEPEGNLRITKGKVILPFSLIEEKSFNYAAVGAQSLLLKNKDIPIWLATGLAYTYGAPFCQWETGTRFAALKEDPSAQLAEIVAQDTMGNLLSLNEEAFYPEDATYENAVVFTRMLIHSMAKKYGEAAVLNQIDHDAFSTAGPLSFTAAQQVDQLLTENGILHGFWNDQVYAATATGAVQLAADGYERSIVFKEHIYGFQNSYCSDEVAINAVEQNEKAYAALDSHLGQWETFHDPPSRTIFYFSPNSPISHLDENGNAIVANITSEKADYVSATVDLMIGPSSTPWIDQGVKQMLGAKLHLYENAKTSPSSLLSSPANQALLAFSRSQWKESGSDSATISTALSGFFCEWLEKQYGESALSKIYSDFLLILGVTGKPMETLRYEWLQSEGLFFPQFSKPQPPQLLTVPPPPTGYETLFSIKEDGSLFYESPEAIYFFEPDYLSPKEMWRFIYYNDRGIQAIEDYLGPQYTVLTHKITYHITSSRMGSQASVDDTIDLAFVKDGYAEYVHEATHCLGGIYDPIWINEGFAVFVDRQFTAWFTPPTAGENLDDLAREILYGEGRTDLLSFDDKNYTASASSSTHLRAYIVAASLVQYIEKTYGKEKLLMLQANYKNMDSILGTDFNSLVAAWEAHLKETA